MVDFSVDYEFEEVAEKMSDEYNLPVQEIERILVAAGYQRGEPIKLEVIAEFDP